MKEAFKEHRFTEKSTKQIATIILILNEYRLSGYRLTLRQLYYQMVARGELPNKKNSYDNLGNLVTEARLAGLIDWGMIEDRNRETNIPNHWDNPAEMVDAYADAFAIDKWMDQQYHLEVIVEKDALSGVLEPVCRDLDVGITADKGYGSTSILYEIGKRLSWMANCGKSVCIIYLGDHDPSGIDMTRDLKERLEMYSGLEDIEVDRVALNMDQIRLWKPPENPAKEMDKRYKAYVKEFGESCWELDAVPPDQLAGLVRSAVLSRRDNEKWQEAIKKEKGMQEELHTFVDQYNHKDM
ncbi:MAG: hypothetical protein ABSG01_00160 [Anaerolineales bacterium]|jgi:hypothetical protein